MTVEFGGVLFLAGWVVVAAGMCVWAAKTGHPPEDVHEPRHSRSAQEKGPGA